MEFFSGIIIAIIGIISVLLVRSITTLVHEYGHALPALLFTDEKVEVYIGSYGNIENSTIFTSGRLTTYFTFNMLNWNMGLCRTHGSVSIVQNFIITLGGPIASILLSIPLILWFQQGGLHDFWQFVIPIFALSAAYDFIINIIPWGTPMKLHDGSEIYNDGQQLVFLFKSATKPPAYWQGFNFLKEKKYTEALTQFQRLLDQNIHDRSVYEAMADCLIGQKKYYEALELYENILNKFKPKAQDYSRLGALHLKIRNYETALDYLNKAIHQQPHNAQNLNNRGCIFLEYKDYREAAFDLNNAIRMDENYADAYANRGLLHIKTNEMDAAKWDLEKALSIDENHALAYLHLGYWYERGRDLAAQKQALAAFQKAEALGVEERNMDWILAEAKRNVGFE